MRKWESLMIHHSATEGSLKVADIRAMHLQRGFNDIGYHYLVERDGSGRGHLKKGRSDLLSGAHAGVNYWNKHAIGLCVIGYFHPGSVNSEKMQEQLYQDVLAACLHLMKKYNIAPANIMGHRDAKPTACPGDFFPLARLRKDILDASR